jgi:CBS domain-containing protein
MAHERHKDWHRTRASEVMRSPVIALAPETPLRNAVRTLEENEIGGAPVVDTSGRPVGFFSARDVARSENLGRSGIDPELRGNELADLPDEDNVEGELDDDVILGREDYSAATLGAGSVQDWMNPTFVVVQVDDPLPVLCRLMVENRLHRVLVMDGEEIKGIVSSMDIMAHLAHLEIRS